MIESCPQGMQEAKKMPVGEQMLFFFTGEINNCWPGISSMRYLATNAADKIVNICQMICEQKRIQLEKYQSIGSKVKL